MATSKKTLGATSIRELRDYALTKVEYESMDLKAAISVLEELYGEREEKIRLNSKINAFYTEGLAAVQRVMEREFGYSCNKKMVNPFSGEEMPNNFLTVELGDGETIQVTNAEIPLPGMDVVIHPHVSGPFELTLSALLRRKFTKQFNTFVEMVREEVRANSIYRGKMLEISFDEDGTNDMRVPTVTTPPNLSPSDLILPRRTHAYVDAELFQYVSHIETNRKHGLSMNRKVLLSGPYGTGKSLTAGVLAKLAKQHGITFIWFKPSVSDNVNPHVCLKRVLEMARFYGPAIVFMEDIDQLLGRQRDGLVNEVVNTLDGIIGKDAEVLFVATSNEPEALDPVSLRRFDLLVSFELPDEEAAQRLVRHYSGPVLAKDTDLTQVGKVLAGHAPSVIASSVEAARRVAIYRGVDTNTEPALLAEDVLVAAEGRAQHVALINRKPRVDRDPVEQVADSIITSTKLVMEAVKPNGHAPTPSYGSLRG